MKTSSKARMWVVNLSNLLHRHTQSSVRTRWMLPVVPAERTLESVSGSYDAVLRKVPLGFPSQVPLLTWCAKASTCRPQDSIHTYLQWVQMAAAVRSDVASG